MLKSYLTYILLISAILLNTGCASILSYSQFSYNKIILKDLPENAEVSENTVVFASSSGNESSAVYREKQHGYFTYYLLKKLQESKREADYKTLDSYLNYQVKKATGLNGKVQNPQCTPSSEIEGQWENWKLR